MAKLHFSCTSCGCCCHGLRLPLSVDEALRWVSRGGQVHILCHAAPDIDDGSQAAAYRRERRFAARSGDLAILVQVVLVARFEGACPNLRPDLRCGIYDERPNVCRIYPAEVVPGLELRVGAKLCPPEAWSDRQPPFLSHDDRVLDPVTQAAIHAARDAGVRDLGILRSLVTALGIDVAALENEGFAVWTIDPAQLADALRTAVRTGDTDAPMVTSEWHFLAPRVETAELIASTGATIASPDPASRFAYLPLY